MDKGTGASESPSISNLGVDDSETICRLTDIRIECAFEDAEQLSSDTTQIDVELSIPGSTWAEALPFDKISSREWKSNDEVNVPDELIFVVKFDGTENTGQIHLGKAEIEGFKSKVGSNRTTREFKTNEKGSLIWRLKFEHDTFLRNQPFKIADPNSKNLKDFDEAVFSQQQAVQSTPEGHEDMPDHLNNLGIALSMRFKQTGNLADIEAAISAYEQAIHLTDEDDMTMPLYLNNLGNSLSDRFERTGNPSDTRASILAYRRAVHLTPEVPGSSSMAEYRNCLGSSLRRYFDHTKDPFYLQMALSNYSLSATGSEGEPSERLLAAERWAELCQNDHDPSQLISAYNTAIGLVSQVAGLDQTIEMRHSNLSQVSHLSSTAATVALHLARTDLALGWLEQGRCLVWSQLSNLRTPLDTLRASHPAIAGEITRLSRALEGAGARGSPVAPVVEARIVRKRLGVDQERLSHTKLAQEWDKTLTKVRAIPGFEDFLQPIALGTMVDHLPKSGHVIAINIHQDRCDALALKSGVHEVCHIPLPDFSYGKADSLRNRLKLHLHSSGLRMRGSETVSRATRYDSGEGGEAIKDILRDLWLLVVKPILSGIGYTDPPSDLPRIWWYATGPLAFLPIHAAGIYGGSTTATLSDFAISSYIPTVKTLVDGVKASQNADAKKTGIFMISQPNTPGQRPIPGTTKEVRVIQRLFEKNDIQFLCLERAAATVCEGVANMANYSCVHLACHAYQDTNEPLKSGFALHDGRLELSSIIQKHSAGADLAFLSACQTSTGDEKLSEEAVHLAAGMLAAGYRGVVATMWSIQDKYAPRIAEDFYANLIERSEGLGGGEAARALHYATQNLRSTLGDSESSLVAWVPYVHFGL